MNQSSSDNSATRGITFRNPRRISDSVERPSYEIDINSCEHYGQRQTVLDPARGFLETFRRNGSFNQTLDEDPTFGRHVWRTFYWVSAVNPDIAARQLRGGAPLEFQVGGHRSTLQASLETEAGLTLKIERNAFEGSHQEDPRIVPIDSAFHHVLRHSHRVTEIKVDGSRAAPTSLKIGYKSLGPGNHHGSGSNFSTNGTILDAIGRHSDSLPTTFSKIDNALRYCLPPHPSASPNVRYNLQIGLNDNGTCSILASSPEDDMPDETDWVATIESTPDLEDWLVLYPPTEDGE